MYQRYIFVEERGGPSVWISTHMVHERIERRIDQSNINIQLTFLNITSLELGIVVKRVVPVFIISFLLCHCCSPVFQQGCCPFDHSFVVKVC